MVVVVEDKLGCSGERQRQKKAKSHGDGRLEGFSPLRGEERDHRGGPDLNLGVETYMHDGQTHGVCL